MAEVCGKCGIRRHDGEDMEHHCRGAHEGEVDVFGVSVYEMVPPQRFGSLSVRAVRSIGENNLRVTVELLTEKGDAFAAFTMDEHERDMFVQMLTAADAPHWRSYVG